jgi:signal transduction histidine kinase
MEDLRSSTRSPLSAGVFGGSTRFDRETSDVSARKTTGKPVPAPSSVLWLGFTGLLVMMAFTAVDSTRSLRNLELTSIQVRTQSRGRDQLLEQLRTDIYHSSTVLRDYILETDDARAGNHRAELERVRERMEQTVRVYEQKMPEAERPAFRNLRDDLESYWKSLAHVVGWDPAERHRAGIDYLRYVLVPRRAEVVQLVTQVSALDEQEHDAAEGQLESSQASLRRRVTTISILALIMGLAVALVSILRIGRLEQEANLRYQQVEEARSRLRDLSARLVAAQEEERRNISRELHDEVGTSMSAMLVELGRLENYAPNGRTFQEQLAYVRGMAEAGVGSVRNLALLLRPSMLDDLGLIPALRWQAREVTRRTRLKVKMMAEEIGEDIPDSYRTCVYRIVQEALHNCARHAKASEACVTVRRDAEGLAVSIADDGIGFDPRKEKGIGLLGMEERVQHLDGAMLVESSPGKGTVLFIRLPFAKHGEAII